MMEYPFLDPGTGNPDQEWKDPDRDRVCDRDHSSVSQPDNLETGSRISTYMSRQRDHHGSPLRARFWILVAVIISQVCHIVVQQP